MPSLKKLSSNVTTLLPKIGKDLTVFATAQANPDSNDLSSESNMECSTPLTILTSLDFVPNPSAYGVISDEPSPPVRKRERLDHLSLEEKQLRRKIKNRVAAQSARDRKKAKMTELEDQVANFEEQRKYLILENYHLKIRNSKLEDENRELRKRISDLSPASEAELKGADENKVVNVYDSQEKMDVVEEPLEYASLINGPLQKEQDLAMLSFLMMRYICFPTVVRLILYVMYPSVMTSGSNKIPLITVSPNFNRKLSSMSHTMKKWWGPHQKAWNPLKN